MSFLCSQCAFFLQPGRIFFKVGAFFIYMGVISVRDPPIFSSWQVHGVI